MTAFPEHRAKKRRKELEGDYDEFIDPMKNRLTLEEYGAAVEHYRRDMFGDTGGLAAAFDASIAFANEEQRAQEIQDERSATARSVDRRRRAPLTTRAKQWGGDTRRQDFPGIDTPSGANLVEELGGRPDFLKVGFEKDR